jgi:hypothetical protein
VIDFVPVVGKEVVNAAVPPAPTDAVAAMGVTATGLPICVPPLKNVTVPVVPTALLLADVMVAVKVTLVPVVTEVALEAKAVAVTAFDTVTASVTGAVAL